MWILGVVSGFAYGEEEVGDVMCYVHSHTHVREMEAIAQSNERQCNDMVQHQRVEIFPRRLEHEHQHYRLLGPVRCLQ